MPHLAKATALAFYLPVLEDLPTKSHSASTTTPSPERSKCYRGGDICLFVSLRVLFMSTYIFSNPIFFSKRVKPRPQANLDHRAPTQSSLLAATLDLVEKILRHTNGKLCCGHELVLPQSYHSLQLVLAPISR
jgi:hypothetical protein